MVFPYSRAILISHIGCMAYHVPHSPTHSAVALDHGLCMNHFPLECGYTLYTIYTVQSLTTLCVYSSSLSLASIRYCGVLFECIYKRLFENGKQLYKVFPLLSLSPTLCIIIIYAVDCSFVFFINKLPSVTGGGGGEESGGLALFAR